VSFSEKGRRINAGDAELAAHEAGQRKRSGEVEACGCIFGT
jgi:hypothetical protein